MVDEVYEPRLVSWCPRDAAQKANFLDELMGASFQAGLGSTGFDLPCTRLMQYAAVFISCLFELFNFKMRIYGMYTLNLQISSTELHMLDVVNASVPGDYFELDENYTVEYVEDHVGRSWGRPRSLKRLYPHSAVVNEGL